MTKKADKIPRFVLSLTDTHTTVPGPNGPQYYSVTVAVDKLADLNKPLSAKERAGNTSKTELERVMRFFQEAVDKLNYVKEVQDHAEGADGTDQLNS